MSAPVSNDLRILIAEDDFMIRQVLTSALRVDRNPVIDTAPNGLVAREMIIEADFKKQPYHIVFLDWEMPVMLGIDVLKYFRDQPRFNTTAFVMVTSISAKTQVIDAIKSGATGYLIKPVTIGIISKKMVEILRWLGRDPDA